MHINAQCDPGPYLDTTKFSSIASAYRGGVAVVLKSLLEELIPCAYDPKTVFGFLKPGRCLRQMSVTIIPSFLYD